jgi:hypothetical protein
MYRPCSLVVSAVWLALTAGLVGRATASHPAGADKQAPILTAEQLEADWLRENAVRGIPVVPSGEITPEEDAAGGCDGVIDGRWGFHTNLENDPWWQIDLKRPMALDQVHIYNRCDHTSDRASRLLVLLSDDGDQWKQVYQHDGTVFCGYTDGKPLAINLRGNTARYVRIQLPGNTCLHLDEVEVYETNFYTETNRSVETDLATQSSTCEHSTRSVPAHNSGPPLLPNMQKPVGYATATHVQRGAFLAADLMRSGVDVGSQMATLQQAARRLQQPNALPGPAARELYLDVRRAVRRMSLANPLLDFDDLLFVKRHPSAYPHMSDQYYGWWSRAGGGLYLLEDFKTDRARLRCLTTELPPGNILRPDLSHDGKKVLFAYAKFYPGLHEEKNKLDKGNVPEDAFYHLYEMNLDGTGLRRLTRGKYDDFDGRYLPGGEIVFLSTRRGQYIQCGKASGMASIDGALPDSYVRCGGGPERPVAVYTLHVMDAEGGNLRQISAFEEFEWTPSVHHDGRVLYARWDYVDRSGQPFMSLWSTLPDGTNMRAVFGNYDQKPLATFEPRSVPGSQKIVFTASGHHAGTGGSLVLLDPARGDSGDRPLTRLTPEVPFPEIEGWPETFFANPYPLSEDYYLVAWSNQPLGAMAGAFTGFGIYLFDAFGNLTLIYRDPSISCMYPMPVRPRKRPADVSSSVDWDGPQQSRMLVVDVHRGLKTVPRGTIRRLRLVGIPVKTHPVMHNPPMGLTHDDPGKFVMGTVPVEEDGSAYFQVPSGVNFFLQALDEEGKAVQTMRSATYVQPGQTFTCVGCHEPRNTTPPNAFPLAAKREPSRISPGPEGSWPFDYQTLVQPVLQRQCVTCHKPDGECSTFDLTADKSYDALTNYGDPSLRTHVVTRFRQSRSTIGGCAAAANPVLRLLDQGHYDVRLTPDEKDRLITWMDTYGQLLGSFSKEQEDRLVQLRQRMASIIDDDVKGR